MSEFDLNIRKVEKDDLIALLFLSKKTFFDAFYHLNKPADMDIYSAKYFTLARLQSEWSNPQSGFYFAEIGNEVVGYIKINYGQAQSDIKDANALEIERIYVSAGHQGKKVGKRLFEFALQNAVDKQLEYVWLGVWEHNHRAIKFYQQHGFEIFGKHDFMLGEDLQVDVLMKKPLPTLPKGECF